MASTIETYCYDGIKSFTLLKWKVKSGSQLFYNSVILSYKSEDGSTGEVKEPLLKYKSNIGGTVVELLASEGDVVSSGSALLKVQPCTHPVIMKDLCAECGTDLRHLDRDNFEKLTAARTFSMVHIVPELKVCLEQAEKLGRDDENRLLTNKKLVLLVDLDQTLIHTTNDNVPQKLPDVHHFQLYGAYSPWYHTKLRPGTHTFLENISKYYELHICTFGARLYAHKIAQILDPNGKFFSHRILSRDECFDATSKTGNLKALFPRGDNMVCIIDDREDVWNFASNVIHVKPYSYFRNTGDINAPPLPPPLLPAVSKETEPGQPEGQNVGAVNMNLSPSPNKDTKALSKIEKQNGTEDLGSPSLKDSSDQKVSDVTNVPGVQPKAETNCKGPENSPAPEVTWSITGNLVTADPNHADDYLLYLEEILINVHKTYYDMYSKMKKNGEKGIPDVKTVVPYVRSRVLKDTNIVFSSVIPTNCVPDTHNLWTLAESLGAQVSGELELEDSDLRTTHIVASKQGTAKVNAAKRHKGIHVVSLDWLLCCAERWERADERLFPLSKDAPFFAGDSENSMHSFHDPKAVKSRGKRSHGSKRKPSIKPKNKNKEDTFSEKIFIEAGLSLSQEDIEDMDREIDEACSEASDDENQNAGSSSESSSSVESLSSGDYPRGWKKRRKCDNQDLERELDDAASESSDAETIGSVDEEIADAVKQEFGNY